MADNSYEMTYTRVATKQSEPQNNVLVESGYIRVRVTTLITFVLLSILITILAATGTGLLVYFTTAGDRECKLALPEGTDINNTEANKQDEIKVQTTTPVEEVEATWKVQEKTTKAADNSSADQQGPGAIYTRWGKTVCPNNTKTLYDGYAAGSHYKHSGGMVDTLCLPKQPQFSKTLDGVQSHSLIFGAEYESGISGGLFDKYVHNQDVPCVVCEATGRLIQVMLPARTGCFDGWEMEYTGYMMSEHINHHRTQVKCVDRNPEVLDGLSASDNGRRFYFIEPAGQLPDPPYNKDKELTCVICTK